MKKLILKIVASVLLVSFFITYVGLYVWNNEVPKTLVVNNN